MSKDIIIQEGGQGRTISSVEKLKTALVGGGTCTWVPEDETLLETKHITENGTYYPEGYGFSHVTVNVSQSYVSGTGEDGNDYVVSVDEETGKLVETLVPSRIEITTLPTTLDYEDGDTIDFAGLVVKAYDGNGNLFTDGGYTGGVVPNSELQFPSTIATAGGGSSAGKSATSDSEYISEQAKALMPFPYIEPENLFFGGTYLSGPSDEDPHAVKNLVLADQSESAFCFGISSKLADPRLYTYYICSKSRFSCTVWSHNQYGSYRTDVVGSEFHNGTDTFYFWQLVGTFNDVDPGSVKSVVETEQIPSLTSDIAYTILYGNRGAETVQEVPVNWPRYNDGKILSDTFEINVSPASSSGGSSGGTTVDDEGFSGHDGDF